MIGQFEIELHRLILVGRTFPCLGHVNLDAPFPKIAVLDQVKNDDVIFFLDDKVTGKSIIKGSIAQTRHSALD